MSVSKDYLAARGRTKPIRWTVTKRGTGVNARRILIDQNGNEMEGVVSFMLVDKELGKVTVEFDCVEFICQD